jgi:hypothetical protein
LGNGSGRETPGGARRRFGFAEKGRWLINLEGAGNVTFAGGVPGLAEQLAEAT